MFGQLNVLLNMLLIRKIEITRWVLFLQLNIQLQRGVTSIILSNVLCVVFGGNVDLILFPSNVQIALLCRMLHSNVKCNKEWSHSECKVLLKTGMWTKIVKLQNICTKQKTKTQRLFQSLFQRNPKKRNANKCISRLRSS